MSNQIPLPLESKQYVLSLFDKDDSWKTEVVLKYIQNKSNSYEDRLEVWKATPERYQVINSYVWNFPDEEVDDCFAEWVTDRGISRHEKIEFTTVDENDLDTSPENLRKFFESCMAGGVWGCFNDW